MARTSSPANSKARASEPHWLPQNPVWGPEQNALREKLIAAAQAAGKTFHHSHDWPRGDYVLLWHDGELLREVRAAAWRESWTQFDPEMHDRDRFPKSARRGLTLDSPDTKRTNSRAAPP